MLNIFKFVILIIFLVSCNIESNSKISISGNVSSAPQVENPESSTSVANPESTTSVETSNFLSTITFTPLNDVAGSTINLGANLSKLVMITNTGSTMESGLLTPSGVNSGMIELIAVSNVSQANDGVSYTLSAGESAKFLVVRKSDFSSILNVNISNTVSGETDEVASVESLALGYDIIFWFSPRDLDLSHVNDDDNSTDISDGDSITTIPDRSGNSYHLTPENSVSLATVSISNGRRKINLNGTATTGTPYSHNSSSYLGVTSGQNLAFLISFQLQDTTSRQALYIQNVDPNSYSWNTMYGIDLNTYRTAGSKHGTYINSNSYDILENLDLDPHNIILSIADSSVDNSITANSQYFVDNVSKTFNSTYSSVNANNLFSNEVQYADTVRVYFDAIVSDFLIINSNDISNDELENLRCYIALKNGVNSASCI